MAGMLQLQFSNRTIPLPFNPRQLVTSPKVDQLTQLTLGSRIIVCVRWGSLLLGYYLNPANSNTWELLWEEPIFTTRLATYYPEKYPLLVANLKQSDGMSQEVIVLRAQAGLKFFRQIETDGQIRLELLSTDTTFGDVYDLNHPSSTFLWGRFFPNQQLLGLLRRTKEGRVGFFAVMSQRVLNKLDRPLGSFNSKSALDPIWSDRSTKFFISDIGAAGAGAGKGPQVIGLQTSDGQLHFYQFNSSYKLVKIQTGLSLLPPSVSNSSQFYTLNKGQDVIAPDFVSCHENGLSIYGYNETSKNYTLSHQQNEGASWDCASLLLFDINGDKRDDLVFPGKDGITVLSCYEADPSADGDGAHTFWTSSLNLDNLVGQERYREAVGFIQPSKSTTTIISYDAQAGSLYTAHVSSFVVSPVADLIQDQGQEIDVFVPTQLMNTLPPHEGAHLPIPDGTLETAFNPPEGSTRQTLRWLEQWGDDTILEDALAVANGHAQFGVPLVSTATGRGLGLQLKMYYSSQQAGVSPNLLGAGWFLPLGLDRITVDYTGGDGISPIYTVHAGTESIPLKEVSNTGGNVVTFKQEKKPGVTCTFYKGQGINIEDEYWVIESDKEKTVYGHAAHSVQRSLSWPHWKGAGREWDTLVPVSSAWFLTEHHSKVSNASLHYTYQSETRSVQSGKEVTDSIRLLRIEDDQEQATTLTFTYSQKNQAEVEKQEITDEEGNIRFYPHMAQTHYLTEINLLSPAYSQILLLEYSLEGSTRLLTGISQLIHTQREMIFKFDYENYEQQHILANTTFGRGLRLRYTYENQPRLRCPPHHPPAQHHPVPEVPSISYGFDFVVLAYRIMEPSETQGKPEKTVRITFRVLNGMQAKVLLETTTSKEMLQGEGIISFGVNSYKDYFTVIMKTESHIIMTAFSRSSGAWAEAPAHNKTWKYPDTAIFRQAESLVVIAEPGSSNLKIFDFKSDLPGHWKETPLAMTLAVMRIFVQNSNCIWTYDDRQLKVLARTSLDDPWIVKVASDDVAGLVTKERELLRSLDISPAATNNLVAAFSQDGLQVLGNQVLLTAIKGQGPVLSVHVNMLLLDEDRNVVESSLNVFERDNLLNLTHSFQGAGTKYVLHYVINPSDQNKFQVRVKSISGKAAEYIKELGNVNGQADEHERVVKELNESAEFKTIFRNNVLFNWGTNYRSTLTAQGVQSGEKTFLRMSGTGWGHEAPLQVPNKTVNLGKEFSLETSISNSTAVYTLYRLNNGGGGGAGGKTVAKQIESTGQLMNAYPLYLAWQQGGSTKVLTFTNQQTFGPEFEYQNENLLLQSSGANLVSFKNQRSSTGVQNNAFGYELVIRPTWSFVPDAGRPMIHSVNLSFQNLTRSTSYVRSFKYQRHSNQVDDTCMETLDTIPAGTKTFSGWEEQSVTHHYLGIGNSKNVSRTQKWFNKNGVQVFQPPNKADQNQNQNTQDNNEEETSLQKDGRVKGKGDALVIADFVPFSVKDSAAGYVGFESYEQPAPQWKFNNLNIVQNSFSLTGRNFLRLDAGSPDSLEGNFKPAESQLPYVVSAWLRLFNVRADSSNSNRNYTEPADLLVGASVRWFGARVIPTPLNSAREETREIFGKVKRRDGDWAYVEAVINAPNLNATQIADSTPVSSSTSSITVFAGKGLTPSMVLDIDHIRISPLAHEFAATVYDDQSLLTTAKIEWNGLISRILYHGRTIVGNIKSDGQLERIVRTNKVDSLCPAPLALAPSNIPPQQLSTLTFVPQSGFHESFDPFALRTRWLIVKGEESAWTNAPGKLWHTNRNFHTIHANTQIFNLQSAGVRAFIGLLEAPSGLQLKWEYWTLELNRQSDQFVSLSVQSNTADSRGPLLAISQLPSYAEYIVVLENQRMFVWLEGVLLVDQQLPLPADFKKDGGATTPWASFSITARGSTLLRDCLFMNRPRIKVEYQNPLGDKTQVIQLETQNTAFITQTLFDLVGRGDIRTKMTRITRNATRPLLAFQSNFVAESERDPAEADSLSVRETGGLKGEVSELHPKDDGVPYFRTLFDDSPLHVEVVAGLPGNEFGVNGRYAKRMEKQSDIPFIANHFPYSLGFVQKTERVPGGILQVSVFDQNKNLVASYRKTPGFDHHLTTNEYNDQQQLVKILPPMYHQMADTFSNTKPWQPGESHLSENEKQLQRDFCTFYTYNAKGGQETKITPDGGRATFIFNQDEQVRFTIYESGHPANGSDNTKLVTYLEYDQLAQLSRSGYFTQAPPVHQLTAAALNSTSSLPYEVDYQYFLHSNVEAEPSDRGRFRFFFTANDNGTLGEQLSFNHELNLETKVSLDLPGINDPQLLSSTKMYNEYQGGRLYSMEYPHLVDGHPFRLTHQYNRQGQLVGLGIPGRSSHFAQFQYHPSGHISTETHLPWSPQNFTRTFNYNSPGFLETITDPFLTQEIQYTSQGYGQDGHGDGTIMRSTFTNTWSEKVDRREFRIKDDQIQGYQFSVECVRSLKRLGFITTRGIPSNDKQFHSVHTSNQLPLVCGGKIASQLAKVFAEKQLPKISGYAYAYGNHAQLVRAKYFTDPQTSRPIEPLQQNSFAEISGTNIIQSKDIWRKLVGSGHILIDQQKYDPNDAYFDAVGKPGKGLFQEESLRRDLEDLSSGYTKYTRPITELLLKYFSEGTTLTQMEFEKIFLDWEKITDSLITVPALVVQSLTSEAGKIFRMLAAKQYTSGSALDSSLRSTFTNLTDQLRGTVRVLKRHFSTGLGTHPFDLESYDIDPNGNHRHFYNGFERFELEYRNTTNQIATVILDSPFRSQLRNTYVMEHDFRGNVIRAMHKGIRRLTYHPVSQRTTRIELTDGRSLQLHYDYHGERILKQVKSSDGAVEQEIYYIRDEQGRVLMDRVSEFATGQVTLRTTTIYIYGPRGLLGFLRNKKIHSVITDHAGSPRLVVLEGQVVAAYDYYPYGLPIVKYEASMEAGLRYLFTGQEWDAETGLYNYHARLYDPSIARFYQMDPQSQYFSPYKYAGNSPVSLVDPDGELAGVIIAAIIGAVIGAYIGASSANNRWNPLDWDPKSGSTYIGLIGGAIAGAAVPIGFAASFAFIAHAGTFFALFGLVSNVSTGLVVGLPTGILVTAGVIAVAVPLTLGIGGAYLVAAASHGWDLSKWEWTRPGVYNSLVGGFGLGSGFIGGIAAPFQFAAETFGAGTHGATVFVSVSFAFGFTVSYAKTGFANKEVWFWNWDYTKPATYTSLVQGFSSGYSWPQGFVAIGSSFKLSNSDQYIQLLERTSQLPSKLQLLRHLISDPKGPFWTVIVSGSLGFVSAAQANNNTGKFWNWDWKSFDTYEAILNGNVKAADMSSLLAYIKNTSKKLAISYARSALSSKYGVEVISLIHFYLQHRATFYAHASPLSNSVVRTGFTPFGSRPARRARDTVSGILESLLKSSTASRHSSLLAQLLAVPAHWAHRLSSATLNVAEFILRESYELPFEFTRTQSQANPPPTMESRGLEVSLMEPKRTRSSSNSRTPWVENCVPWIMSPTGIYNQNAITCFAQEGTAFVFPFIDQATGAPNASAHFNTDRFKSCRPLSFNGHPSVGCDGDESYLIYTPNQTARPFDTLDGNIMLAACIFPSAVKYISSAISWFARSVLGKKPGADQASLSSSSSSSLRFISFEEKAKWEGWMNELKKQIWACEVNNGYEINSKWAVFLFEDLTVDFAEILASKSLDSIGWIGSAHLIDVFLEKLAALEEDVAEVTWLSPDVCYRNETKSDDNDVREGELVRPKWKHVGSESFGGKDEMNFLEASTGLTCNYYGKTMCRPGNKFTVAGNGTYGITSMN